MPRMRQRRWSTALVILFALAATGCQSSHAQRGDYPRDGHMASPMKTPTAGYTHDKPGYTQYDAR